MFVLLTFLRNKYWLAHEILELIAYAQMSLQNARVEISSEASGLLFDPGLHLPSYFVYAINKGSGETAHMRRLA